MKTYCKPKQVDIKSADFNRAAVFAAFDGKRNKKGFRKLLLSTGKITAAELARERVAQSCTKTNEAIEAVNQEFTERIRNRDIHFEPVRQFQRVDGISQKTRDICQESEEQQIAEYIAVYALMPLFRAKLLHCQCGSIPNKGQSAGKRQIERILRRKFHCRLDEVKIDVTKAYPSVTNECVMELLRRDIGKNKVLLWFIGAVMANYPDGHLLIGGYLPTWLYNYVMSYVLRYMMGLYQVRRGVRHRMVWAIVGYADDTACFGRISNLKKAIKKTTRWAKETLGLKIKDAWDICYFGSFSEEKTVHEQRKINHSRKRTPGLDMVGFVIRRTYTIIRGKIFVRIRRQIIRAQRDMKNRGYIPWWRAVKLMAYHGWIMATNSQNFRKKYNYKEIFHAARHSVSAHGKKEAIKREQRILLGAA